MQKFIELLTDDQKEQLKNCYLVTQDNELCKLTQDKGDELTTENFKVIFENGKAVDVQAEKGLDVLEYMLNMDESSRYLGEVALVPFNSPVNETGILFSNTLFDENACCHFAFGFSFKNCIKGYENMTDEDFKAVDFNDSVNHVDFMIGSADLEIKGYDFDGNEYVIFKDGVWAI